MSHRPPPPPTPPPPMLSPPPLDGLNREYEDDFESDTEEKAPAPEPRREPHRAWSPAPTVEELWARTGRPHIVRNYAVPERLTRPAGEIRFRADATLRGRIFTVAVVINSGDTLRRACERVARAVDDRTTLVCYPKDDDGAFLSLAMDAEEALSRPIVFALY